MRRREPRTSVNSKAHMDAKKTAWVGVVSPLSHSCSSLATHDCGPCDDRVLVEANPAHPQSTQGGQPLYCTSRHVEEHCLYPPAVAGFMILRPGLSKPPFPDAWIAAPSAKESLGLIDHVVLFANSIFLASGRASPALIAQWLKRMIVFLLDDEASAPICAQTMSARRRENFREVRENSDDGRLVNDCPEAAACSSKAVYVTKMESLQDHESKLGRE